MPHWLNQIILNEYIFTFIVTVLSVVLKAATSRKNPILKNRNTFDLSLELVFIAISFAVSKISQLVELKSQAIKLMGEEIYSAALKTNTRSIEIDQVQALTSHIQAMWILCAAMVMVTVILVIMLRKFGHNEENKLRTVHGIIIPNIIGLITIVLVMAHIYTIK